MITPYGIFFRLISKTVLIGFSADAAVYISITQLPKLIGLKAQMWIFTRLFFIGSRFNEINLITLCIGIVAIVYLVLSEKYLSKLPNTLIIVVIPILLFSFVDLS